MGERSCTLFVDLRISEENLLAFLHEQYGGAKHSYHVDCDWAELYAESNSDHSWLKKRLKEDGFLFFRHCIYIDGKPDISHAMIVERIRELMESLRQKGARIVPACDFEDELNRPQP